MTLQCLQEAGDVFAAGVSVAPVTDWRDYDTAYTERYLGLPLDNPTNYKLSSPLYGAHELKRPLLLAPSTLSVAAAPPVIRHWTTSHAMASGSAPPWHCW